MMDPIDRRGPPPRGTPEWYLYKRKIRQAGRRGGRLARFREIAKRKQLGVEDTLFAPLDPVFVAEYRHFIWQVDPVLCTYCNVRLSKATRTRDHVHPRSRGGGAKDNLVPACGPCNRAKADHSLLMYLLRRARA